MQEDMHFYGTYAIARAAGIPDEDAYKIAYSAQFVDDSTKKNSEKHADGGLIYGIATAHHGKDAVINSRQYDLQEQRRVWVPFHFIPAGEGASFEEKLICRKDSAIANAFFKNHIGLALQGKDFALHLLGIAAHVYADTFSHYGFSGMSSKYNMVQGDSIVTVGVKDTKVSAYIKSKLLAFLPKSLTVRLASAFAERAVGGLGHGGVATYPDRPFLHWQVEFDHDISGADDFSDRDNPATYLEGAEKLHGHLSEFARGYYDNADIVDFASIRSVIGDILRYEADKAGRIAKWKEAIDSGVLFTPTEADKAVHYDYKDWEKQKDEFHKLANSSDAVGQDLYLFHQAATYHRYYVLKDLLPSHGIVVY